MTITCSGCGRLAGKAWLHHCTAMAICRACLAYPVSDFSCQLRRSIFWWRAEFC